MAAIKKLKIEDVNSLSADEFKDLFKNVVELWPNAGDAVVLQRPFAHLHNLIFAFVDYLDNLNLNDKVAVLQSHPDLAGKLLTENKLSEESAAEQAFAGLNRLTDQQQLDLVELNQEYANKFGFPFVICVRQTNKIEHILSGIRERLPNNRNDEIINGIDQVKNICQIRIESIVQL